MSATTRTPEGGGNGVPEVSDEDVGLTEFSDEGGADETPEVKVSVKSGKGKRREFSIENRAALEALAGISGTEAQFYVERVAPAEHDGRKVQCGRLKKSLAIEDLRDPSRLHSILGHLGREFYVGFGKRKVHLEIAGGDLRDLDYDDPPAPRVQTMPVMGPNGVVMNIPVAPVAGQAPQSPFAAPWGAFGQGVGMMGAPVVTPDLLAKTVRDIMDAQKKDADAAAALLKIEEKRLEREVLERKEAREERERKEAREEKERRERLDAEQKRLDREERDRKERRDREEKEDRERKEREAVERKERADERARQEAEAQRRHEAEMKRLEENSRAQIEAARASAEQAAKVAEAAAKREESFFDKYLKMREIDKGEEDRGDEFDKIERMFEIMKRGQSIIDNPRSLMGEVLQGAPGLVRAIGEEVARVKTSLPLISGPQTAAVPQQGTCDREEFFDGLVTFIQAVTQKVDVQKVVDLMKRPRLPTTPKADRGCPNLVAICAQQGAAKIIAEIQGIYADQRTSTEERKVIESFQAAAQTPEGADWLAKFFGGIK